MKNLYSRLSAEWDELFPPDKDRLDYLKRLLGGISGEGCVVEVGCGTGSTAGYLQSLGYRVRATDLDPEMVSLAESGRYPEVEFSTAGMLEALDAESGGSALGILCLGNTLPHLADWTEVRGFFREVSRVLQPGGLVLVQILNYSRIIDAGSFSMPDLKSGDLVFSRRQEYRQSEDRVVFHTVVDDGRQSESRSHSMLPLRYEDVVAAAESSGLLPADSGSDWNGSPAGPDSTWFHISFRKVDA